MKPFSCRFHSGPALRHLAVLACSLLSLPAAAAAVALADQTSAPNDNGTRAIGPSKFGHDLIPPSDGSGDREWVHNHRPPMGEATAIDLQPTPGSIVFFPPPPPVFSSLFVEPSGAAPRDRKHFPAPPMLVDFVSEDFYPALGTRLFDGSLSKELELQILAYRDTRNRLSEELTQQLSRLASNDAATRERQLRTFAELQTPSIVALEQEAERIREALLHRGFWEGSRDWSSSRSWRLPVDRVATDPATEAEFQVVRAAIYYQAGLSPAQRRLLRELAVELRQEEHEPRAEHRAFPGPHEIFFLPDTTLLRLPATLSSELRAKIDGFDVAKTQLKQELRRTVPRQDSASKIDRTEAFATLAKSQHVLFSTLEGQAEEIRHALRVLPDSASTTQNLSLPEELARRVAAYRVERLALDAELKAKLDAVPVRKPNPGLPPDARLGEIQEITAEHQQQQRETALDFEKKNFERYESLRQTEATLRRDLAQAGAPEALASAESATKDVEPARPFEPPSYQIALLQPGLSPEQRRLLLATSLAGVAVTLPEGEAKPTSHSPAPKF